MVLTQGKPAEWAGLRLTLPNVVKLPITQIFRIVERLHHLSLQNDGFSETERSRMSQLAQKAATLAEKHDLAELVTYAERLRNAVDKEEADAGLRVRIENLRDTLNKEISKTPVLLLKEPYADWYRRAQHKTGGTLVKERLPELWDDYKEACYCYACEHFSATQLLLCRVLETSVRRLAKSFRIDATLRHIGQPHLFKDWMNLCEEVESELTRRSRRRSTSARELQQNKDLSAATMYLSGARMAWRNSTMHPDRNARARERRVATLEATTTDLLNATTTFLKAFAEIV